jgi:hypothetical protein
MKTAEHGSSISHHPIFGDIPTFVSPPNRPGASPIPTIERYTRSKIKHEMTKPQNKKK